MFKLIALFTVIFTANSFSQELSKMGSWDFVAPTVYDLTNVDSHEVGLIVYDAKTDSFHGRLQDGTFRDLGETTATNDSVITPNTSPDSAVVYSALIDNTSTLTIATEYGSWLDTTTPVQNPSTNLFRVNFKSGAFKSSSQPICTVNVIDTDATSDTYISDIEVMSDTQLDFRVCRSTTVDTIDCSNLLDQKFVVLCHGVK